MTSSVCAVSIIVPVYKVEKYIERCACSLFEQTFEDVEYIFVNDDTPDNSMVLLQNIVETYPDRKSRVKIINHSNNQGSAKVRNTGLMSAEGEYIIQVDSDDWVERDMIEKMYAEAIEKGSEIVWTDYYREERKSSMRISQCFPSEPLACVKAILSGQMHGAVWNKLVKRTLFVENGVFFPEDINMWEDVSVTVRLFYYAKNIVYLPCAFYHYVQYNNNSYTRNVTDVSLRNMKDCVDFLERFFQKNGESELVGNELNYLKLTVKHHLIIQQPLLEREKYANVYPETTPFIMSYSAMGITSRVALWLGVRQCMGLSNLIYFLIPFLKRIFSRR